MATAMTHRPVTPCTIFIHRPHSAVHVAAGQQVDLAELRGVRLAHPAIHHSPDDLLS